MNIYLTVHKIIQMQTVAQNIQKNKIVLKLYIPVGMLQKSEMMNIFCK